MEPSVLVSRRRWQASTAERRARFGALLAAVSALFLIQGIAAPGRWEQLLVAILLALTLVLAALAAEARPVVMRGAVVLASIVVLLSLIEAIANRANGIPVRLGDMLLVTLAPPAVVIGIVRDLRARNQVTIESVLGVLVVYLLLGMLFAFLYGLIGRVSGTFFVQDVKADTARCLYFSFTTMTTVGYGDLTAATNLGHTLSVSEALVGQIYLVTVVSVIVGNLGRRRRRSDAAPPTEDEM